MRDVETVRAAIPTCAWACGKCKRCLAHAALGRVAEAEKALAEIAAAEVLQAPPDDEGEYKTVHWRDLFEVWQTAREALASLSPGEEKT